MITRKEEQILLSIVHLKDKAYLVNVRQRLKDVSGRYQDVGSINKTLKKLERDGYLNTTLGEPKPFRGGRAIKYYALTERAYAALIEIDAMHRIFWEDVVLPSKIGD